MITAESLKEKSDKHYQKQADISNEQLKRPVRSIRASMIGTCARRIYFTMVEPEKQFPWYTPGLIRIFEDGIEHEKLIEKDLEKMGYTVSRQQKIIDNHPELKKVNITGHIDFTIFQRVSGIEEIMSDLRILAECKSLSRDLFSGIETWKDIEKTYWMKKYIDQGTCYMYGTNEEKMVFILKNKNDSSLKFIPMELDQDRMKSLIEKASLINSCVRSEDPPARIIYDDECQHCPFEQHCLPDISLTGKEIIENTELIEILDKRGDTILMEAHKEYAKLDKLAKAIIKKYNGDILKVPGWEIKISRNKQTRITIKES